MLDEMERRELDDMKDLLVKMSRVLLHGDLGIPDPIKVGEELRQANIAFLARYDDYRPSEP